MKAYEILTKIQCELKAPKNQYNSFGKYHYRSCEDILEALKPLLNKHGVSLFIQDDIVPVGDRYYIKATCTFCVGDETISNSALAREEECKKGMDGSQIIGTASSYARKYALNGLFLIDDTKYADTDEYKQQGSQSRSQGGQKSDTLVSEAQLKRMYAIGASKGYDKSDIDKSVHKKGKQSAKDLTVQEYNDIVAGIEKAPIKGANK